MIQKNEYRIYSNWKTYVVQIKVGKRWRDCNTIGRKASLIDRFIGDVAKTESYNRAVRYKRAFEYFK